MKGENKSTMSKKQIQTKNAKTYTDKELRKFFLDGANGRIPSEELSGKALKAYIYGFIIEMNELLYND